MKLLILSLSLLALVACEEPGHWEKACVAEKDTAIVQNPSPEVTVTIYTHVCTKHSADSVWVRNPDGVESDSPSDYDPANPRDNPMFAPTSPISVLNPLSPTYVGRSP